MIPDLSLFPAKNISSGPPGENLPDLDLKPGQTINAKILDVVPGTRAQLLIGSSTVEVSTRLPLTQEMEIPLTLVGTRNGVVLKPALPEATSAPGSDISLQIVSDKKGAAVLAEFDMTPGRTVTAKVLDVVPRNRVQLVTGGKQLTVSTQLPFKPGMEISLTAAQTRDGIVLKPSASQALSLPGDGAQPLPGTEKAFQTTPSSFIFSRIFQGLAELGQTREPVLNKILMGLALKSGQRDDQFLPRILEDVGLNFEKKLADGIEGGKGGKSVNPLMEQLADKDLKAAVLTLLGSEGQSEKAETLKHIIRTLDSFGQLNAKAGEGGQTQDGNRFLIPFPVWTEEGFDFGQLMVDVGSGQSKGAENKLINISFLLNMTALGPLRADFSILDKTLAGGFLLEDQETCDYIDGLIPELRSRLSGIGYKAGTISCRVAEPDQITPASLMISMKEASADEESLDIVV